MSKRGGRSAVKDIISKARSAESQNTRKAESTGGGDEELVNLGVKVSLARRRHWAAESKRTGISMTSVIIDALVKQFGEPE